MVGLASTTVGANSDMETEQTSVRKEMLQKLLTMAQVLYKESALLNTEIVGKEKLSWQEFEQLRDFGNRIFLILHETSVGQTAKKLQGNLAIYDIIELQYPLQITTIDAKKAAQKKKFEAKRLKRKAKPLDSDPEKDSGQETERIEKDGGSNRVTEIDIVWLGNIDLKLCLMISRN